MRETLSDAGYAVSFHSSSSYLNCLYVPCWVVRDYYIIADSLFVCPPPPPPLLHFKEALTVIKVSMLSLRYSFGRLQQALCKMSFSSVWNILNFVYNREKT